MLELASKNEAMATFKIRYMKIKFYDKNNALSLPVGEEKKTATPDIPRKRRIFFSLEVKSVGKLKTSNKRMMLLYCSTNSMASLLETGISLFVLYFAREYAVSQP